MKEIFDLIFDILFGIVEFHFVHMATAVSKDRATDPDIELIYNSS